MSYNTCIFLIVLTCQCDVYYVHTADRRYETREERMLRALTSLRLASPTRTCRRSRYPTMPELSLRSVMSLPQVSDVTGSGSLSR